MKARPFRFLPFTFHAGPALRRRNVSSSRGRDRLSVALIERGAESALVIATASDVARRSCSSLRRGSAARQRTPARITLRAVGRCHGSLIQPFDPRSPTRRVPWAFHGSSR